MKFNMPWVLITFIYPYPGDQTNQGNALATVYFQCKWCVEFPNTCMSIIVFKSEGMVQRQKESQLCPLGQGY